MNWQRSNRKIHYWGSIFCALPLLIILLTGFLLLFKKQSDWVQPPTMKGTEGAPSLLYGDLLKSLQAIPEMEVESWDDVDRLDVRPSKGVIKVRGKNRWEAQLDHQSGDVLAVAFRRSDLIESLHDGSFFGDWAKFGIFLPAALILLVLWVTGLYLFALPFLRRRKRQKAAS